jgi:2-(1,2-epoxy-1,2-dihydrophenyl)acetyl-CoA isomerase
MSSNAFSTIQIDFAKNVAHLMFARPQVANTMDLQFGRDFLASALAIESSGARAVVISGQGKNFCFGGDLKGMVSSGADVQTFLSELTTNLHAGLALFTRLNAPVIAAVTGTAAGAGLGVVLAADIAIAEQTAKFVPAYTAVGLTPDAGCTFFLPRAIGYKRAMEMLLMNRVLDATEALTWGLVNQVVGDGQVVEAALALAARFADGPHTAFGGVKRLLSDSQPGYEAQLARESRLITAQGASAQAREGIAAFIEKRSPNFQ